jgi:type I restriction enzyme M protein
VIPDESRSEIVRIYHEMLNGNGEWGEFSKILDVSAFGYREIRVERPLRMAFQVEEARVAELLEATTVKKLNDDAREKLVAAILARVPRQRFMDRAEFERVLMSAFKSKGVKVGAPILKAIFAVFGERDQQAEVCRDGKGRPEPDPQLREHELVPMEDGWRDYVEREVAPFVRDFWVDEGYVDHIDRDVGRVGYEINFNRFFYRYTPPRPLGEIDDELRTLEAEIAGLLKEIAA